MQYTVIIIGMIVAHILHYPPLTEVTVLCTGDNYFKIVQFYPMFVLYFSREIPERSGAMRIALSKLVSAERESDGLRPRILPSTSGSFEKETNPIWKMEVVDA